MLEFGFNLNQGCSGVGKRGNDQARNQPGTPGGAKSFLRGPHFTSISGMKTMVVHTVWVYTFDNVQHIFTLRSLSHGPGNGVPTPFSRFALTWLWRCFKMAIILAAFPHLFVSTTSRPVARKSSMGGFTFFQGDLNTKTLFIYSISYFNLGRLWALFSTVAARQTKPTKAPPWRRDWLHPC